MTETPGRKWRGVRGGYDQPPPCDQLLGVVGRIAWAFDGVRIRLGRVRYV